jgi:hypothetical protein
MISWLTSNVAAIGLFGAAITFIWSAIQFILQRRKEQQDREFEVFHRLVKELVSPEKTESVMRMDRQIAVVFELRHFHRYYEVTGRILKGLREHWETDPENARLVEEIGLTLESIRRWKPGFLQRLGI